MLSKAGDKVTLKGPLERKKTITSSGPGVCTGGPTSGAFCTNSGQCSPGTPCVPLSSSTTTYDYVGGGRVARRDNGNNTQTTFEYDNARRTTRTVHLKITPADAFDDRTYTWDPMNNKISRTTAGSSGSATSHSYGYDSAGQMTHSVETPPAMPPSPVTIDYTLDGVGNRLSVAGGPEAGPYGMSASLPEPADRQVNQYTSTPFDGARSYDRNGNLVQKPGSGVSMSYDYRNQMVSLSGPLGSSGYAYDPFGRRILANGKTYVHDGYQEIEEHSASGALTMAIVYGNGLDDARKMVTADVTGDGIPDVVALHEDDLGNVVAATDPNSNVPCVGK